MAIVEGVYRLLGLIAPINQRLGRLRLNFIPANFVLMFGLGAMAFFAWSTVGRVLASRKTPEPQTVETLLAKTRFANGYVAVQGRLNTEARLTPETKQTSGNSALAAVSWVPLVDAATGAAMLVQFDANHPPPDSGAEVTIEGIVRPVSSLIAKRLKETKFVHAGVGVDRRFMLVAGRKPGDLPGPLMTGIVCGVLALAFLWSSVTRNVAFMPAEPAMSGGRVDLLEPGSSEALLVSATLTLDGKTRRFFTNMPAVMHRTETGETALLSHIVSTSTYFGIKTSEHAGVWMLPMRPGSITETQPGHVFWGLEKRRAMRFRYINAMTGASEQAVVASAGRFAPALAQAS